MEDTLMAGVEMLSLKPGARVEGKAVMVGGGARGQDGRIHKAGTMQETKEETELRGVLSCVAKQSYLF